MVIIDRILPWTFIGLAIGISLAEWGNFWWSIILAVVIAFIALRRQKPTVILLAVITVFGAVYWDWAHPRHPGLQEGYLIKARILVLERPYSENGEMRFTGLLQEEGVKVRVFLPHIISLKKGDLLQASGSLREIRGPSNPGDFNYKEYWSHRGVFYNFLVREQPPPRVAANRLGFGEHLLSRLIDRGQQAIRAGMTAEQAVLMEGMLFGFQDEISREQYARFQQSGIVHIFSVSGFHVGFIVLIGVWVANRLGRKKPIRLLTVLTLIMLYGFMTGWPAPMVRASVMASLGLTAHYFGREEDLPSSLAAAGILLLLINPANLFEISFQLSFLATWGIIYLYPRWRDKTGWQYPWERAVLLSLAPQVATLPLTAYYFNLVSLVSVVSNLLLINVAGGAIILGFLGVVAAQLSPVPASVFMIPAGFLTALVQWGSNLLGGMPGGFLWVAQPAVWTVPLAYLGMVLLWGKITIPTAVVNLPNGQTGQIYLLMDRLRTGAGIFLILLFAASLLIPGQFRSPGALRVVFLDVGQGDAVFVKTPQGFTILVDGGGSDWFDVGREVVLPYLRRQGIRSLDLAVATHPHTDHLQGLKSVLEECPARMVVAGEGCLEELGEIGGEVILLQGLREFSLSGRTKVWMWVPEPGSFAEPGNETSVILKIAEGEVSFLLTGDAGVKELEVLMAEPGLDLSATVLKLPHHGSRHSWSDDFIERVDPDYGVISVGLRNPFGHPSPEVLTGTREKGVRIFRTDLDGTVTFVTRGRDIEILTGP
ncbi:MAG: DNA internalization-related competence protein ComEC/Rec2 [Syntrophomonadaceae bacterium]|nr:DNA internalization-related competence protein ComEC/Rec2 [Syntrophomonadaceae bacterium]